MSRRRIFTASSVMLMACISAWSLEPVKSQVPPSNRMMVNSAKMHIAYSKVSPPSGGVRLLQDIFNRVRSAPQIALEKQRGKRLAESQQLANADSLTDYSKTIRPKEKGKNLSYVANAPSLYMPASESESFTRGLSGATNGTIGPQGADANLIASNSAGATRFRSGGGGGGSGGSLPSVNMGKWVKQPGDNMYSQPLAAASSGNATRVSNRAQTKMQQIASNASPAASLPPQAAPQSGGYAIDGMTASFAGKYKARPGTSAAGALMAPKPIAQSPAAPPPPLSVSIGKLGRTLNDTNKKMEEVDKLAAEPAPATGAYTEGRQGPLTISMKKKASAASTIAYQTPAAPAFPTSGNSSVRRERKAAQVNDERAGEIAGQAGQGFSQTGVVNIVPSQQQQIAQNTNMKTYVQQRSGAWNNANSPGIWEFNKDTGAAPQAESTEGDAFQSSFDSLQNGLQSNNKRSDRDLIALLPPNVVTGIPLVRLGSSEQQAASALAQLGTMKVDQVNNWKVWTWSKNGEKSPALQLFVRHGLLDAMRIFDRSLIGSDFGVTLGDDLSKVKEQFGEPAFMVPEPAPGAGQNYIYPISQVGFQIARPAPDQSPRVVSVLIFHVK